MIKRLIFLFIIFAAQHITAQCVLIIHQVGIKKDSMPQLAVGIENELVEAEYNDSAHLKLNDSTLQFTFNLSEPDDIFIVADYKARWETHVWIAPEIKGRELIIDYSKKTITLKKPTQWDMFLQKIDSLSDSASDKIVLEYIEQYPDSFPALWFLSHSQLLTGNPNKALSLFNKLNPALNKYPEYHQIKADLSDRKYPNVGDTFKEFSLIDKNGLMFNSTNIKGKWILLNFWSNGCGPCVREMDALVNLYNSIDTSKIAFISIALDENENKWKDAKATNKIMWTSVWEADNWYGDLCLNYNITAMPSFILFNKERKIVFIKDGAEELENIKSVLLSIK
jgi:thiol-disulfide isomerase/thioredoxin